MSEAVSPQLAGLQAAQELVMSRLVMAPRMLVRRLVAAADLAALQTHPKMEPGVAFGQTLGTAGEVSGLVEHRCRRKMPAPIHLASDFVAHRNDCLASYQVRSRSPPNGNRLVSLPGLP